MRVTWRMTVSSAVLMVAVACSREGVGPAGESGLVTLRITSGGAGPNLSVQGSMTAPPGSELIASATVEIGAVSLVGAEDGEVTLTDAGGTYDLLDLQNGVTATLASVVVPAGTYIQLRLEVLSASVTLVDGTTFADGSGTQDLVVPSGAHSGIKINLDDGDEEPGFTVAEGESIVLLDFDVSRNFVLTGPPGAPLRALFTPSVRQVGAP